jgi:hypothetical protein
MFALEMYDGEGRANAAGVAVGAVFAALVVFRSLHRRLWFWIAISFIAFAQVAAVWLIPWPDNRLYGVQLAVIGLLHIAGVVGLIWLLHKIIDG